MKLLNKKYGLLLIGALLYVAVSCEVETDWNTVSLVKVAVVDAIITDEYKYHTINIYSSSDSLNGGSAPISGASVTIRNNNSEEVGFVENPQTPGEYVSEKQFSVSAGVIYQLTVNYGDVFDTAYAEVEGITPMESFEAYPAGDYYRYNYVESSMPSMMEVYYNWSGNNAYCDFYGAAEAAEVFYSLNSLDIVKFVASTKQVIEFPEGTQIIRRKYSLSKAHQDFVRSLLIETEWRGGIFDVEPGNVPTNFRNGTVGWFGTCMVLADTINFGS